MLMFENVDFGDQEVVRLLYPANGAKAERLVFSFAGLDDTQLFDSFCIN